MTVYIASKTHIPAQSLSYISADMLAAHCYWPPDTHSRLSTAVATYTLLLCLRHLHFMFMILTTQNLAVCGWHGYCKWWRMWMLHVWMWYDCGQYSLWLLWSSTQIHRGADTQTQIRERHCFAPHSWHAIRKTTSGQITTCQMWTQHNSVAAWCSG